MELNSRHKELYKAKHIYSLTLHRKLQKLQTEHISFHGPVEKVSMDTLLYSLHIYMLEKKSSEYR